MKPKKNKWICGKCEQDAGKYPGSEKLPKHSRHCRKRFINPIKNKLMCGKRCPTCRALQNQKQEIIGMIRKIKKEPVPNPIQDFNLPHENFSEYNLALSDLIEKIKEMEERR